MQAVSTSQHNNTCGTWTHLKHIVCTPKRTLTHTLPSSNTKPQVFSWKNTLVLLKPIARIIFSLFLSLPECSLSVMNLYLTATQLCKRDFSAAMTFLALSVFVERALCLLCWQIRLEHKITLNMLPIAQIGLSLLFGISGDFQCKFIIWQLTASFQKQQGKMHSHVGFIIYKKDWLDKGVNANKEDTSLLFLSTCLNE